MHVVIDGAGAGNAGPAVTQPFAVLDQLTFQDVNEFRAVVPVLGERGPISEGAETLNNTLLNDPSQKLVVGRSQGSQISGFWLRNYAPHSLVDPDSVQFYLLADPENTYGIPWAPRVPTNTGYQITEMWIQYDGWADWPTRPDPIAIANAVYGMLFIHSTWYDRASIDDPSIIEWTANGIHYRMVPTPRLPLLDPLRNLGFDQLADALDAGAEGSRA